MYGSTDARYSSKPLVARSMKLAVLQSGGEDFAPDRVGERDVGADVESEPAVGPLRALRAARIDDVELRAVVDSAKDVMEEDRMRLARVRSPEDDRRPVRSTSS